MQTIKLLQIIAVFLLVIFGIVVFLKAQDKAVHKYRYLLKVLIPESLPWGALAADPMNRRLLVASRFKLLQIDMDSDRLAGEIPDLRGVISLALVHGLNKGFAGHRLSDTVTLFDIHSFQPLRTLTGLGIVPGFILYDPFSLRLLIGDHDTPGICIMDPVSETIIGHLSLPAAVVGAVSNEAGQVFVQTVDARVVEIEMDPLRVTKEWPVAASGVPSGLAIDTRHHVLFSLCDGMLLVSDYEKGEVLTALRAGKEPDTVIYDAGARLLFISGREGLLTIIKQISATEYDVVQTLATRTGCNRMALDAGNQKLYLPAKQKEENEEGFRKSSFDILVYWNQ